MSALTTAEKQLITALHWFRSRYALYQNLDPERPATREAIEAFGQTWIGTFKADWEETFDSLMEKGILLKSGNTYAFTEKGQRIKEEVEAETPFYRYEYDYFFSLEKKSEAHREFLRQVYGMDLSQHGLTDQGELQLLADYLKTHSHQKVLDLGCGNGRITEYLASFSGAGFHGIDISEEAIREARERTRAHADRLRFSIANLNHLDLPPRSYDLILSIDTLYYADNPIQLLRDIRSLLKEGGVFIAYYSQWIMDEAYADNLLPDNTHLAKALREQGFTYQAKDLTASGLNHWKRKLSVLEATKEAFEAEGHTALWNYRHREAERYARWGDGKYGRYFYVAG